MKHAYLLIAAMVLSGCNHITTLSSPPANLMMPCRAPVALKDDSADAAWLALIDNTWALLDCSERNRLLAEWVR